MLKEELKDHTDSRSYRLFFFNEFEAGLVLGYLDQLVEVALIYV
jgi:hypothetical protein